jgi:haloalkane dehalogenase
MTPQSAIHATQSSNPSSLYPFEGRFLYLDGIRYHYLDEGDGAPTVMLHGNPTWSFYFRNLVQALRDDYRVIVPDHIGCGLSDKPSDSVYDYTLARRVRDLELLIDHLGINRKLTLLVHDWGGMIGLAYAVRHLERIGRLVILNTAAFPLPATKRFPWQLRLCRAPGLGALLVRGLNLFCRGAAANCVVRQPLTPEVRAMYLRPYDSWRHRIAVHRFVEDIPLRAGDPSYPTLAETEKGLERLRDRPMLICWGERDFIFDLPFLAEWQRRFPAAEVHRFADAGHYVLEDAGAEIVELVKTFLKTHSIQ